MRFPTEEGLLKCVLWRNLSVCWAERSLNNMDNGWKSERKDIQQLSSKYFHRITCFRFVFNLFIVWDIGAKCFFLSMQPLPSPVMLTVLVMLQAHKSPTRRKPYETGVTWWLSLLFIWVRLDKIDLSLTNMLRLYEKKFQNYDPTNKVRFAIAFPHTN